jgi:3-phenylpropionate/cinnamic acid dioxygenase small subunit
MTNCNYLFFKYKKKTNTLFQNETAQQKKSRNTSWELLAATEEHVVRFPRKTCIY